VVTSKLTVHDLLQQSPKNMVTDFSEIYGVNEGVFKEAACYLKTNSNSVKEYHVSLVGADLFFFKRKEDLKHKLMHCLVGAFVSKKTHAENEKDHSFSIKIQLGNYQQVKSRKLFFLEEAAMNDWFKAIKQASGYRKVEEEYEIGNEISRGKFGIVYSGSKKDTARNAPSK